MRERCKVEVDSRGLLSFVSSILSSNYAERLQD